MKKKIIVLLSAIIMTILMSSCNSFKSDTERFDFIPEDPVEFETLDDLNEYTKEFFRVPVIVEFDSVHYYYSEKSGNLVVVYVIDGEKLVFAQSPLYGDEDENLRAFYDSRDWLKKSVPIEMEDRMLYPNIYAFTWENTFNDNLKYSFAKWGMYNFKHIYSTVPIEEETMIQYIKEMGIS